MSSGCGSDVMTGTVRVVLGKRVRALVDYGSCGERMLCDLPRALWRDGRPPETDQCFRLCWDGGAKTPTLEILEAESPRRLQFRDNVFIREARALLGFRPDDRILVVVGPNPKPLQPKAARYFLINAGWGEALALTRLPYLFMSFGIDPCNVETLICEVRSRDFHPEQYASHHIVFLGSIKSNVILREFYWEKWPELCERYKFVEDPVMLRVLEAGRVAQELRYQDNIPVSEAAAMPDWEAMSVLDHFLLARVPNPYATDSHYQCILSSGTGTIGTGYGVVAMTARQSVRALVDRSRGQGFHAVGEVHMQGFFNPRSDPLRLLRFGSTECDEQLLAGALSSPVVWSPAEIYTDEERARDRAIYESLLGKDS